MGLSSKKTTTDTKTSSTVAPTNPQWVTDSLQGLNSRIGSLGNVDPTGYVAGASDLQKQAWQGAGALAPSANYGTASDLVSKNASALPGVSAWMNPFTDNVVNTTLNDFDANSAKVRAQQAAGAAKTGAFGGSRYGITEANTEDQLARARASADAQLRSQGYESAAGHALSDAQLGQSAGTALANIGTQAGADNRSNIALQDQIGGEQRGIAQDMATAPITLAQVLASLYGQNQLNLFQGQQSDGTSHSVQTVSDPMGAITSALGGVAGLATGVGALGGAGGLAGLFSGASKAALGGDVSQYAGTR